MGLIFKITKKYPQLKGKEWKIKQIMDLIFYALFLFLIWNSRPIYVDYCSTDLSLNASPLKDMQAFWSNHTLREILPNATAIVNITINIMDVDNVSNSTIKIGNPNESWMYPNP